MNSASTKCLAAAATAALLAVLGTRLVSQELPKGVTPEDLATNNKLFLEVARKGLKWEEPAEPVRIAGPISSTSRWDAGASRGGIDRQP